ncbi:MAG TPA: 30S ribosomal protein S15 [archaeon]|nr:30S ribosomal protein S15 [archaeon]
MAKGHSENVAKPVLPKAERSLQASRSGKKREWVEYDSGEIEQIIVDSANAGMTPAEIGMTLRDQYGVPNVKETTGLTVEKVLAKHGLLSDIPRELLNLIKRSVVLQKHMATNKKDQTAKRGYMLTVSKIRRLTDYYQSKGKLDKAWRYTAESAALLVK